MAGEDLEEHFHEGYKNIGRLCIGINRRWKKFKSDELMTIPEVV
jgi:hypothetical protein